MEIGDWSSTKGLNELYRLLDLWERTRVVDPRHYELLGARERGAATP